MQQQWTDQIIIHEILMPRRIHENFLSAIELPWNKKWSEGFLGVQLLHPCGSTNARQHNRADKPPWFCNNARTGGVESLTCVFVFIYTVWTASTKKVKDLNLSWLRRSVKQNLRFRTKPRKRSKTVCKQHCLIMCARIIWDQLSSGTIDYSG